MSHLSNLPRRPRLVKVPKVPPTARIRKRLDPIFVDDRSKGRRRKVQFHGWHQKRRVLINKRALCLKHVAILLLLLVLVSTTTLGTIALPELSVTESKVDIQEDVYLTPEPTLLDIEEEVLQPISVPVFRNLTFTSLGGYVEESLPVIDENLYVPEVALPTYDEILFEEEDVQTLMFWDEPMEIEVLPYVTEEVEEPEPIEEIEEVELEVPIVTGGSHENVEIVWNFFAERGFSPQAIAGIIGNLQQESGVGIYPGTTGDLHLATTSRGIAQWREGRLAELRSFASARDASWTCLYIQLEFMYIEMQCESMQRRFRGDRTSWHNYMPALTRKNATPVDGIDGLRMETCIENAVRVMDAAFHRSGTPNMPRRLEFAHDAYERFHGSIIDSSNYYEQRGTVADYS